MARAVIIVDEGTLFRGIRCEQGDLAVVGPLLFNLYQHARQISRLVASGGLLSLHPLVPSPSSTVATRSTLADLRWEFISCEYAYLWREEQWLVNLRTEGPTEGKYTPLLSALKKLKITLDNK